MKVQELLSDRSKWTQGRLARDARGIPCSPRSSEAVCWCVYGALDKCYQDDVVYSKACEKLYNCCENVHPIDINDHDGYEAIMELLRKADL